MANEEKKESEEETKDEESEKEVGKSEEESTEDEGKSVVSVGKFNRVVSEKDKKIAKLEAKVEEASQTEEGRKELLDEIAKLKADIADTTLEADLKVAGCKNVKAARAVLDDYDGDISKLKEKEPYLFETEKKITSSGGAPGGTPETTERDVRLRKSMGSKIRNRTWLITPSHSRKAIYPTLTRYTVNRPLPQTSPATTRSCVPVPMRTRYSIRKSPLTA